MKTRKTALLTNTHMYVYTHTKKKEWKQERLLSVVVGCIVVVGALTCCTLLHCQ